MKRTQLKPVCTALAALALAACGPEENSGGAKIVENAESALDAAAKSGHFDAVSQHLSLGGVAYGYLDVDGDAEKLAATLQDFLGLAKDASDGDMPEQLANLKVAAILEDIGLTGIEALGMSSYKNGELYRNDYYLHIPAGRQGLLKVFGGDAGEFAARTLAPAGADYVFEQQLDLKSAFETVSKLVTKVGGDQAAQAFNQAVSEPIPGPGLTVKDLFANLDTRITLIARLDDTKKIAMPEGMPIELPGIDALLALDNVGGLVTKLMESIPADQRAGMLEEGDGFQQMALPLPPELMKSVQPVVRHDLATGRVLIATSAAFLEECLGDSSVWNDSGFQSAISGLPTSGNGISYVSPKFSAEYLKVYSEMMDSMAGQGVPAGMGEIVTDLMQSMGLSPDHHQARVVTNLPEGILISENLVVSAKGIVVAGGAAAGAMLTGAMLVPYSKTSMPIQVLAAPHATDSNGPVTIERSVRSLEDTPRPTELAPAREESAPTRPLPVPPE